MKKSVTKKAPRPRQRLGAMRKKHRDGAPIDWITAHAADASEVRAFCVSHGLVHAGDATVRLAKEVYRPLAVRASVEGDPEGSSEWLVVDVDIQATVEDALEANRRFTNRWIKLLPVSKRLLMRVLYNFV